MLTHSIIVGDLRSGNVGLGANPRRLLGNDLFASHYPLGVELALREFIQARSEQIPNGLDGVCLQN